MWTFLFRRLLISLLLPYLWKRWRDSRRAQPARPPVTA